MGCQKFRTKDLSIGGINVIVCGESLEQIKENLEELNKEEAFNLERKDIVRCQKNHNNPASTCYQGVSLGRRILKKKDGV